MSAIVSQSCRNSTVSTSVRYNVVHGINLQRSFRLAHIVSPYSLNLDRRMYFFAQLACLFFILFCVFSSQTSQPGRPSGSFAVLEIVIIAIFRVVDGSGSSFRDSRLGDCCCLRDYWSKQGIAVGAYARRIA